MESYSIPEFVVNIFDSVFSDNDILKTIIFDDESKLKTISGAVFGNCKNLTNIILPNSLEVIGARAFTGCKSIRTIKFGNNMKTIYGNAFYDCISLETIEFSHCENVTIGENAFAYCNNLKNIIFSNNVTIIQKSCFFNCLSLREIVFPASLESIDSYSFSKHRNNKHHISCLVKAEVYRNGLFQQMF